MSNPFVLDVSDVQTGMTEAVDTSGPSPVRWGGNMLAVLEDTPTELHGTISNVGEAVMVNATVEAQAHGTCSLCLQEITTPFEFNISDVFGFDPGFIGGDEAEGDEEGPHLVEDGTVDVTQLVLDEAGLNAPFSPVCEDFGQECLEETPAPAGIVDGAMAKGGESARPVGVAGVEEEDAIDPRWAGLQKFVADDQSEK